MPVKSAGAFFGGARTSICIGVHNLCRDAERAHVHMERIKCTPCVALRTHEAHKLAMLVYFIVQIDVILAYCIHNYSGFQVEVLQLLCACRMGTADLINTEDC